MCIVQLHNDECSVSLFLINEYSKKVHCNCIMKWKNYTETNIIKHYYQNLI